METAIGVFESRAKAEEGFKRLIEGKVPQEAIAFLTLSESDAKELGTYAGGFLGSAAGMAAGVAASTIFLIPGLGQAFAIGLGATALLGFAGARAGSKLAESRTAEHEPKAIPDDEFAALFRRVLKDGQSVIIVRTESKECAAAACRVLDHWGIGTKEVATTRIATATRHVEGVSVVDVRGRITLGEGNAAIRELMAELIAQGHTRVVLNLIEVDHIDSAGIGELVRTHSSLRRSGGQLKLASLNPKVASVLRMTSLNSVFDIHADEGAAVRSFGKVG